MVGQIDPLILFSLMDLGYSNVMINYTTVGRITTEELVNFLFFISVIGLGIILGNVRGILNSGYVHFPWEIIFLMTSSSSHRYIISQFTCFSSMKFTCTR